MKRLARVAVGLAMAATPLALSGAPAVHADTLLDQVCTTNVTLIFDAPPILTFVYDGVYTRDFAHTCTNVVLTNPNPGVQVQPGPTGAGQAMGTASGGCVAALLTGGGDFRNGAGVLIGGTVLVAGSAFPLTNDIAFAEVDLLVNQDGIPCLTEHTASGPGVNDTVL